MEIKTVEVVEVLPTRIWADKDTFGTVHIKMQHQGMDEFDFIQIQNNEFIQINHNCDIEEFRSLEELTQFLTSKGKFYTLCVFSIIKLVDLKNLSSSWRLRYKLVDDVAKMRNNKIDFITSG